jgi:hypothetical protein
MTASFARFFRFGDYWVAWSILLGCGVTVASTLVYFAWANAPTRQIKIAEIVGPAENRVLVNQQPVQVGATVTSGQQILTLPEVRVGLKQTGQILARLGAQSSAILETDCIQLGEGQLVVSQTAGCLGAAIATSQNGIFVLERLGTLGEVKVLSGEVTLSIPSNPALGTITLSTNQKLTLSLTGDEIGPVRLMLPIEVSRLVQGELFQGFQQAIAAQQTIAGLPTPSPGPNPSPSPSPRKPLQLAQPPADKVPAAVPQNPPVASPPPTTDVLTRRNRDTWEDDRTNNASATTSNFSAPRSPRRRRYVAPSYDAYAYRRKWTRSPYSGNVSRRRSPGYSPPAATTPSHPEPANDLPTVPEVTVPELPTPIELPPAIPPTPGDTLPPPAMVEPPLETPNVK